MLLFGLFVDPLYLVVLGISMVLGIGAQAMIKSSYKKYSKIGTQSGYTGAQIAQAILRSYGLTDVSVNRISGNLSDHYNPAKKELNLSGGVYGSKSIASIGIAAHECGHAIQHAKAYSPIKVRNAIVPIANIGNMLVWPMVIFSFIAGIKILLDVAIIFFMAVVVFHIVTLPVEFDASRRAISILRSSNVLTSNELGGAKKVLQSAAMTYVAGTLIAILNLVYLLVLRGRD